MTNEFGFIGIIPYIILAWAVFDVILLVKIWMMTNDVKALRQSITQCYIKQDEREKFIRKSLLTGKKNDAKSFILEKFAEDIESSYQWVMNNSVNPSNSWEQYKKKSIAEHVNKLKQNLDKIGETIPADIEHLQTYEDYFNLFSFET